MGFSRAPIPLSKCLDWTPSNRSMSTHFTPFSRRVLSAPDGIGSLGLGGSKLGLFSVSEGGLSEPAPLGVCYLPDIDHATCEELAFLSSCDRPFSFFRGKRGCRNERGFRLRPSIVSSSLLLHGGVASRETTCRQHRVVCRPRILITPCGLGDISIVWRRHCWALEGCARCPRLSRFLACFRVGNASFYCIVDIAEDR